MGRSSSPDPQTNYTTQTPPNPDAPLNYLLLPAAERMLEAAGPYAQYGSGHRLLPQAALGQVYTPGPNPTLFGNAFSPAGSQAVYGQAAAPPNMQQYGMGGAQQGGAGGGGGGGSTNPFQNLWNGGYQPQQVFGFGWAGGGGFGQGQPQQQASQSNNQQQSQQQQSQSQPLPQAQAAPTQAGTGQQQQQPNTPTPSAPAPPTWNQNTPGGDPYGIAANNAPVGPGGQPQTLEQMQQMQQQIQSQNAMNQSPDWSQILGLLQGGNK